MRTFWRERKTVIFKILVGCEIRQPVSYLLFAPGLKNVRDVLYSGINEIFLRKMPVYFADEFAKIGLFCR